MEKVIPTFYSEYGRYISRFRMIPLNIDCLIPVERRTLLILNRFGYSAPVKSFKIDGCVTGELHPHGSAYGTLVNLVRNGFASDTDSTWGGIGLNDCPAPASRYSTTRIKPWVSKFAFEFIKHVPWENLELDYEPLYLPSILPLGLIGDGLINGISYYKTVIPKYSKEDLAIRLKWLIEHGKPEPPKNWEKKMSVDKYGPIIKPNKADCNLSENEKNAYYKLLLLGEAEILYSPKVQKREIEVERNRKKQKIQVVSIEGRAPNATFDPLLKAYEKGTLPISNAPIDQSKGMNICVYLELKKSTNIDSFMETLSSKYLNRVIHYKCYTCNLEGRVFQTSIDTLLLNCFIHWKEAYRKKLISDILSLNSKILEYHVCSFIRDQVKLNVTSLNDILLAWNKLKKNKIKFYSVNENNIITEIDYVITVDDFTKIYNSKPIKSLVEFKATIDECENRKKEFQDCLSNIDTHAVKRIDEIILKKEI